MTHQLTRSVPTETPRPSATDPILRPSRRRFARAFAAALVVGVAVGTAGALVVSTAVAPDGEAPPPAVVDDPVRPPAVRRRPAISAVPLHSASVIIQDEIEQAIAERRSAAPAIGSGPSAEQVDTPAQRPAYLIIQDEIDRALAERNQSVADAG